MNTAFDFEYWSRLAHDDPEGFERLRTRTLKAALERARPQRQDHLKRLQWRLDRERERAPNPLAACVTFHRMLLDKVREDFEPVLRGDIPRSQPTGEPPRADVTELATRRKRREH